MKILRFLLIAISVLPVSFGAVAQHGIDNPVTKAVLGVYENMLRENPNDYMTLFRRANEYYHHNEYIRSLKDIEQAIKLTPQSDKDLRFQEFMLRGAIYSITGRHAQALADFNEAVNLDPTSYAAVYQRANTEYELEQFAEAKADYQKLQRMNSRSSESPLGLARIAIKENNLGLANDYLAQAVALDPNNADTYVRRASVRKQMGDHNGAVDDLILAVSSDSKNNKAIEALVEYGNTNYTATMTGLTNAIRQVPGITVLMRRPHGPGCARYLPMHQDAAVGNDSLNLVFRNDCEYPIYVLAESTGEGTLCIQIFRAD